MTWNLFHGRDHPPEPGLDGWRGRVCRSAQAGERYAQVNRPLLNEFAACLARLSWDVALLQEAPPRWLGALGTACEASGALALTSRNWLPAARRAVARRNPDLIASNEGGSNMLLVRAPARVVAFERHVLTRRPERRVLLLARVELSGGASLAVANTHLSVPATGRGEAEALAAARLAARFAGDGPLILGGDLNLRPTHHAAAFEALAREYGLTLPTAPEALDHLLARGLGVIEAPRALSATERELAGPGDLRLRLSDHAPVAATFGMA